MHVPILQALVLCDHLYVDRATGKKVLAGTFNRLWANAFPTRFEHRTWAFLCLTDLRGKTALELRFVDLASYEVLMQTHLEAETPDPNDSVELCVQVPPFPMPREGTYAFEVLCGDQLLGSLRVQIARHPESKKSAE